MAWLTHHFQSSSNGTEPSLQASRIRGFCWSAHCHQSYSAVNGVAPDAHRRAPSVAAHLHQAVEQLLHTGSAGGITLRHPSFSIYRDKRKLLAQPSSAHS